MYTNTNTKRFPAPCRFFSQGNCRAGQDCHFAHILPLKGTPKSKSHSVLIGEALGENCTSQDHNSIQKAIRDLELDQFEKKYQAHLLKTIHKDANTIMKLNIPLENKDDIKVQLIVPFNYPDTQCTLQVQNTNMSPQTKSNIQAAFEDHEWHQMRHKTLVQQLDWLVTHFASL